MKIKYTVIFLLSLIISNNNVPLSQKGLNHNTREYQRGIFLIVLASQSLENYLGSQVVGDDFIEFKKTQGFDVDVVSLDSEGINSNTGLKGYLQSYKNNNPMLEYVLLVGDWNGSYDVPTFTIPSYNEDELDVTDYTYTYVGDNVREPRFFIGRWPVRQVQDLLILKAKTIEHTRLENVPDIEHFDDALLVSGNFKDGQGVYPWNWPVTPRWTNLWLRDQLEIFGYDQIDTVFYHAGNYENGASNPGIANSWNSGIGVVNYRGWGDANGWHKPLFHREEVEQLNNGWKLPIVLSFVCNTGDFGNDYSGVGLDKCFGETLVTAGTTTNPKGAVAMVGPSDLDTDTRFNNVICGAMWDEILEFRKTELAPALQAGKDSVGTQFEGLIINNTNIPDFYYHIYGVLGDPSIPIRLTQPTELDIQFSNSSQNNSHVFNRIIDVNDNPVKDVVVAALKDGNLIGKDISNDNGEFSIDFVEYPGDGLLEIYLNHPDYYQKKLELIVESDNGEDFIETPYTPDEQQYADYIYDINLDDGYGWVEIAENGLGTNICLTDDSVTEIPIGFNFNYYGNTYDTLTVSSNGWVSFEKCDIPYFWNFSIPFPLGPSAMLAPFMDDLDDNGKEPFEDINQNCIYDEGEPFQDHNFNEQWDFGEEFNVYSYYDSDNNRFIIQWDNVSNGEDDENCPDCVKETFQLVLLDQNFYPNSANQGDILFIYDEINDIDENGNFSTIGVESPDQNFGSQLIFNQSDPNLIALLNDGYSVRFSADNNPLHTGDGNIEFSILNTYPNPFNPVLNINYNLIKGARVRVNIYDINGKLVENIANQYQPSGSYGYIWNASNLASGNYIVKLDIGDSNYSNTITLLK
tara:strand:- start:1090 stop:3666 length:2577 start_codon:yes stop_codon:yes gene_type:complete